MSFNSDCYNYLLNKYYDIYKIESIRGVLFWDLNTYMPPAGAEYRGEQISYLQSLVRETLFSKEFKEALKKCNNLDLNDEAKKRNIELLNRKLLKEEAVPSDLHSELIKQQTITFGVWKEARRKADYNLVYPEFKRLYDLVLKKADYLGKAFEIDSPFEALIYSNEPNFPVAKIDELFISVKRFLIPFIKKHGVFEEQPQYSFLYRKINRAQLIEITKKIAELLKYDINGPDGFGRIDEVPHPLTISCGPRDVRVTVRYIENNFMMTLKATAHEIGHALHGLDWNPKYLYQPIQHVFSPSFGESQSRYVENIIGFNYAYWEYLFPIIKKITGNFNEISTEKFYEAITQVKPSLLRVGSDEVTYSLHIIIRYELEKELFAGELELYELPEAWNQKYVEYLGLEVPDDGVGVLQDIHWYQQFWGYFFGYAMGDYIAAQIGEKMDSEIPEWTDNLREGKFDETRIWLKERIHYYSGLYDTLDLVEHLTGKQLTTDAFKRRIEKIYSR